MTSQLIEREYTGFSLLERVRFLRALWNRVAGLLDLYCTGLLCIPDARLDNIYLKLCLLAENVLYTPGLEDLRQRYHRPFESLYDSEMSVVWERCTKDMTRSFASEIEEAYIRAGEGFWADSTIQDFLWDADQHIGLYQERKRAEEKQWEDRVTRVVEERASELGGTGNGHKPDLGFIR